MLMPNNLNSKINFLLNHKSLTHAKVFIYIRQFSSIANEWDLEHDFTFEKSHKIVDFQQWAKICTFI